ncbi:MAG: SOUL family heme-binding protein [Limisphaerales bacterium]
MSTFQDLADYPGFEIRRYPASFQARTEGTGSKAFRRLAKYIFSNGIKMTSPVLVWKDDPAMMAFTLPSQNGPTPADSRVQVVRVEPQVVAVARGRNIESIKAKVLDNGLEAKGTPWVAAYDNPWTTLPMFRKYEVHVPVVYP